MKILFNWFQLFFTGEGASMTRLLNLIWIVVLAFVIVYPTIKHGTPPVLDSSYTLLTAGFLAAKIGQKYLEK